MLGMLNIKMQCVNSGMYKLWLDIIISQVGVSITAENDGSPAVAVFAGAA